LTSQENKTPSPSLPSGFQVTLAVTQGPQKGLRYHLSRSEIRIGRRKDMDLILSDATVSGEHARVYFQEDGLWIEDLRSLNGTWVNDRRIRRSALQAADKINLGKYQIEVEMEFEGPKSKTELPSEAEPLKETGAEPGLHLVWLAGYSADQRRVLVEIVEKTLSGQAIAFDNGEQMLTELSARLGQGRTPDLIILNLRMPLISGLNTAISLRAFEQGFEKPAKIPIGFFGSAPAQESESFHRVIKFCKPAAYLPAPTSHEEFRQQALDLIRMIQKDFS